MTFEKLLPYIRLLKTGELHGSKTTEQVVDKCVKLQWACRSGRKNHCVVTDLGRATIPEFLCNQLPSWESYYDALSAAGFEATVDGVSAFEHRRKIADVELPSRVHHKTLACCVGRHSKVGISRRLREIASTVAVTTDQALRIYANKGLRLIHPKRGALDCDQVMAVLGEVVIPERALLDGVTAAGAPPKAVFTIENKGAYIDFPLVNTDLLVIYAPGDDTSLAIKLLSLIPSSIPCYHFGDLDPQGLKIAEYIKRNIPQDLHLFAPEFWWEYIAEVPVSPRKWPDGWVSEFDFPLIRTLRAEKKWLEQERVMLDPRLVTEINRLIPF